MRFSKGRVCCLNTEKETVRIKNLIVHSNIPHNYTMIKDFKTRQPIFI